MGFLSILSKPKKPLPDTGTPETWINYLRDTDSFREVEIFLLSNRQSYKNKRDVILEFRSSLSAKELLWLETKLEGLGYDSLAQTVRWNIAKKISRGDYLHHLEWSQQVVDADIKARWIVQRQAYVKEEVLALRKALGLCKDDEKEVQLEASEGEPKRLEDEYWAHNHQTWRLHEDVQTGALTRAFKYHRSNPKWCLGEWLKE